MISSVPASSSNRCWLFIYAGAVVSDFRTREPAAGRRGKNSLALEKSDCADEARAISLQTCSWAERELLGASHLTCGRMQARKKNNAQDARCNWSVLPQTRNTPPASPWLICMRAPLPPTPGCDTNRAQRAREWFWSLKAKSQPHETPTQVK